MTAKEMKAAKKRIKEIKSEMKELKQIFESGAEWLDGEIMLENECYEMIGALQDELEDLENEMQAD